MFYLDPSKRYGDGIVYLFRDKGIHSSIKS